MARRQSAFGKRPGGMFRGVPGNFGVQKGWGDAFKKIGDWGVLNPNEWVGFGKRQGMSDARPREQFELQQVIAGNLSIEAEMARERAARARARTAPEGTVPVTPPGQIPRRLPTPGASTPVGAKPKAAPKAAPKATPAQAKATPKAAPAPVAAIRKVPLKRGR
jgi:hypothetical protein